VGLQMLLALLCKEVVQPLQADPGRNVVGVGRFALAAPEPGLVHDTRHRDEIACAKSPFCLRISVSGNTTLSWPK